ncbi:MAG: hypothetical protein ACK4JE_06140, partial [Endomicrobiia bacterium]
ISKQFNLFKEKILKLIKISEKEATFLLKNFREKILLRIKIEALKIESWANKRLEKLKENQTRMDTNDINTNDRE